MAIILNKPLAPDLSKLTKYLQQVNENGWYTNFGPLHQQLTCRLEKYLGVKNLLLVSNGTLALQVVYKTLNVTNALTTPFSFVATASSLIWQGIETSFSDIDKTSYNLCPKKAAEAITSNPEIDAIVATHVYGNPCDVKAFSELSEQSNVKIIYDAAHVFGVKIGNESVLNFGDASTLSFHATKVFHTIEGGAIVFKNKSDFERAKRLINFGIDASGNINEVGINGKLNEYQCAVGLTILDDIGSIIEHRAKLFSAYRNGLKDVVVIPAWHQQSNFNGAYMPICLENDAQRELVELTLKESDIQCRQYFSPSLDSVFNHNSSVECANSQDLVKKVLCLPLHFYMTAEDVELVVKLIKKALLTEVLS
jgi:dTDP-4-amino-4,6-dideoxygalactose transaminase